MRIFFLVFLLSLLAACTSPTPTPLRGVTVVPLSPVPSPSLPLPSPTPNAEIITCTDAPISRLIVHERGRSTADNDDPINLRNGPSTDYSISTRIETGEIFYVLDGPSCANGYAWFYVRYLRNGREYLGWIAEGDSRNYYVEPYVQG